jgi:hypothetical protein
MILTKITLRIEDSGFFFFFFFGQKQARNMHVVFHPLGKSNKNSKKLPQPPNLSTQTKTPMQHKYHISYKHIIYTSITKDQHHNKISGMLECIENRE